MNPIRQYTSRTVGNGTFVTLRRRIGFTPFLLRVPRASAQPSTAKTFHDWVVDQVESTCLRCAEVNAAHQAAASDVSRCVPAWIRWRRICIIAEVHNLHALRHLGGRVGIRLPTFQFDEVIVVEETIQWSRFRRIIGVSSSISLIGMSIAVPMLYNYRYS